MASLIGFLRRDIARPINNAIIQPALNVAAKDINTLGAGLAGAGGLARIGVAAATHNPLAERNAIAQTQMAINNRLANNRSWLTQRQADTGGTSLIRPILSGAGTNAPYAVGYNIPKAAGLIKPALGFGATNTLGTAMQGDFRPKDLGLSFAAGAVPLGVGFAGKTGFRAVIPKPPFNPKYAPALKAYHNQAGKGNFMSDSVYQNGVIAAKKIGVDHRDLPAIGKKLDQFRHYETQLQKPIPKFNKKYGLGKLGLSTENVAGKPTNFTSALQAQKYKDFNGFYKDYKPFFDRQGVDAKGAQSIYSQAIKQPLSSTGAAGTRAAPSYQTRFEQAYNAGDMTAASKYAAQIKDPAIRKVVQQQIAANSNRLPPGYRMDNTGSVFDKTGKELTTGQVQAITQPKYLTDFENATQRGDTATMQKIANAHPGDNRLKISKYNEAGFVKVPGKGTPKPPLPKEKLVSSPKSTSKVRGFATTVKSSRVTTPELNKALGKNTYRVKSNKVLLAQARDNIAKDYDSAYNTATTKASDQGVATATELIKYHQAKGEFKLAAEIADKAAKNLTDLGRGVQAASLYSRISPEGIVRYAAREAQKGGNKLEPSIAQQLTKMAKEVGRMPDGEQKAIAVQKMLDLAKAQNPSSTAQKVIDVWKAGLLTAPTTHAGNILSNTIEGTTQQALVNPLATLFDIPTSLVTGRRSRVLNTKGLFSGAVEGTKRGGKYLTTGYDARNPLNKYELQNKTVFGQGPVGKAATGYTQGVFRALGAADQPFYYATLRSSLRNEALTAAKNQGLRGAKKDAFVNSFLKNPDIGALERATQEAKRSVFANQTALGKAASSLKRGHPVGQFAIPFSQVPSSIATRILERSPVGYVNAASDIVKAAQGKGFNQRAFTEKLSNATVGTAGALVVGKVLAQNNMISLGYPQNPKEKSRWQAEGRQPYSVKLGNKWISLNYVQPFGSILAYGAAFSQAQKDGKSLEQSLATATGEASKSLSSQSFLKGVSGIFQAVQDPARSAEQFFETTAGSVVPNAIRALARSTDPLQRQVNTPLQSIQRGIPGQSEKLLPSQDVFGTDMPRPSSAANSLLNPLRPSNIRGTDVTAEVDRLHQTDPTNTDMDVMPTPLEKTQTFGGEQVALTDKQLYSLQKSVGQNVNEVWGAMIATPEYAALTDPEKAAALRKMRIDITAIVKNQFGQENGLGTNKLTKRQQGILDGTVGLTDFANPPSKSSKSSGNSTKKTTTSTRRVSSSRSRKFTISKAPSSSTSRARIPRVAIRKATFKGGSTKKLSVASIPHKLTSNYLSKKLA